MGRWSDLKGTSGTKVIDLGERLLMPGLVNAHCHLDYTLMAGQFPPPRLFTDWLKLIVTAKGLWDLPDYKKSWLAGAKMLVRTGTTTVADIEAIPKLLPDVWQGTPLRVISFLEMIGITGRRKPDEILAEALDHIRSLKTKNFVGLSPHAPYTAFPELLRLTAKTVLKKRWRASIHVAESEAEFEMFDRGEGEMHDWLKRGGRDMSDCGSCTPVEHLKRTGILNQNLLAVHANYLQPQDIEILAARKVNVVHCPRSHSYFGHEPFQARRLMRAGVNICLGTDSLASVYQKRREPVLLDMFAEMRTFAQKHPEIAWRKIVEMATLNGARALGLRGRAGELSKGSSVDVIAVPFSGAASQAYEAILHYQGDVDASMIGGKWALEPK